MICAWGGPYGPVALHRRTLARSVVVVRALLDAGVQLHVLALSQEGIPRHPLMLPYSCTPVLWSGP